MNNLEFFEQTGSTIHHLRIYDIQELQGVPEKRGLG